MVDFQVSGQRVLVVGAARSGIAAAELLARRGARVTLADVKPELPDAAGLAGAGVDVRLGPHDPALFAAADLIVLSPGVPLRQPALARARRARVPIIGEVELAWRMMRGRVVAITGTKGKSTTTTLVGRMLAAAGLNGVGRGEHRRPARGEGRRVHGRHDSRRGGQQLPARDHGDVPPVDRGAAESLGGPPRPAREHARIRRGEGARLRQPGRRRLGGRQRRRSARHAPGVAPRARGERGSSRSTSRSPPGPCSSTGGSCRAPRERPTCRSCR